jgi:hypothetical protein
MCTPAHVCDCGLGGCDHEDCVIGLRADYHRLYDMQQFDVLPHLTKDEQAHLVSHVSLISALEQSTGERWEPLSTEPTNERSCGLMPRGLEFKIPLQDAFEAHRAHPAGWSIRALARLHWRQWGYA